MVNFLVAYAHFIMNIHASIYVSCKMLVYGNISC